MTTGIAGAAIGSFLMYLISREPLMGFGLLALLIAAVTAGLSCFYVSRWYLNFVLEKDWLQGLSLGPLFAGLAGAISGGATGIIHTLVTSRPGNILGHLPLIAGVGVLIGALTGAAFWVISFPIYVAIRITSQKKRLKSSYRKETG